MSNSNSPACTGIYFWHGRLPCWNVYFVKPVTFGPFVRGAKVGNKWNNKSHETILWAVTHPGPLVWIVVESIHCCYVSLVHYKISTQRRLHLWGQSEAFCTYTIYSWVFTIPCYMGPAIFVGLYLPLFLFSPFIILFAYIFHVHSIKFTFHIVLGTPITILDIYGNLIPWFIDYTGFKIIKSLRRNLDGVPSFSVGAVMDYIISF